MCYYVLYSLLSSGVDVLKEYGFMDFETFDVFPSWIGFLERSWSFCAEPYAFPWTTRSTVREFDGIHLDLPLDDLVKEMGEEGYGYFDRSYRDIPAPPWTRRREAIFQQRLVNGSAPPGSDVYRYDRS